MLFQYSVPLAAESQDEFAFMWNGQQWTFQVLPQGHLHSPVIDHVTVARELSLFSFPTSVKWAHYIDDIMFNVDMGKLASAAGHSVDFAGTSVSKWMGNEPAENSRPRYCCKVFGSHMGA